MPELSPGLASYTDSCKRGCVYKQPKFNFFSFFLDNQTNYNTKYLIICIIGKTKYELFTTKTAKRDTAMA